MVVRTCLRRCLHTPTACWLAEKLIKNRIKLKIVADFSRWDFRPQNRNLFRCALFILLKQCWAQSVDTRSLRASVRPVDRLWWHRVTVGLWSGCGSAFRNDHRCWDMATVCCGSCSGKYITFIIIYNTPTLKATETLDAPFSVKISFRCAAQFIHTFCTHIKTQCVCVWERVNRWLDANNTQPHVPHFAVRCVGRGNKV